MHKKSTSSQLHSRNGQRIYPQVNEMDHFIAKKSKPNSKYFAIQVKNCPNSLRLLINAYRFFGFSFSGITFDDQEQVKLNDQDEMSKWKFTLRRFVTVTFNLLMCMAYLVPLSLMIYAKSNINESMSTANSTSPSSSAHLSQFQNVTSRFYHKMVSFDMGSVFSTDDRGEQFVDLKPILRYIIESITYVLLIDAFLNLAVNLLFGARLIGQLCDIPQSRIVKFEDNSSLVGMKMLLSQWSILIGITAVGVLTFNSKLFPILYNYLYDPALVRPEDGQFLSRVLLMAFIHLLHFANLSMIPVFFVYTMIAYRNQVALIRDSVETIQLNEVTMYKMKNQLTLLSEHFKSTLLYFSFPLTLDMVTNALLIIGSSCFMMINKSSDKYYLANIFDVGMFAFVRLVVVCWAGNLATNVYQSLIRIIYENVPEWSLDEWMYFIEIKQIGKEFKATIFNTYTVRQSAILTMLGFALNYIVVLLQTENYGNSAVANATDCNCTASKNISLIN